MIQLENISASSDAISEVFNGEPVVHILRDHIVRIELKKAIGAERPVPQFIFGLVLIGLGFYFSRVLLFWLLYGGTLLLDLSIWFSVCLPVGVWVVFSAFRKRVLLHVYTDGDSRKLLFKKRHAYSELKAFVSELNNRFGYQVDNQLVPEVSSES